MDALGTLPPGIQAIASFIGLVFAAGIIYLAKNGVAGQPGANDTPRIAVADLSAVQKIADAIHDMHADIERGADARHKLMYDLLGETKRVADKLDELNRNIRSR